MNKRLNILLLDEDSFSAQIIIDKLSKYYDFTIVGNKKETLAVINEISPAAILINIGDSTETGFEICRVIRENTSAVELPIIFLCDQINNDELLKIYEVGGDDYLAHSATELELRSRISNTLMRKLDLVRFKKDLSKAFSVAMIAMSSASEVGEILNFLHESFKCPDYLSLCEAALNTLNSFGLDARVQIRGQQQTVSYSHLGLCSDFEESVFETISQQGRLVSFSNHSSCNYKHVTLIAKNMPCNDQDRYGRMLDNLVLLGKVLNERVIALDNEIAIVHQKEKYVQLVDIVNSSLVDMNQQLVDDICFSLNDIYHAYEIQKANILKLADISTNQEQSLQKIFNNNEVEMKLNNLLQKVNFHS